MYIYYVRRQHEEARYACQSQTEIIHYLPQQNGKSLFYIFKFVQMFPAGVSTNHMQVILPWITEKCPPH